LISLANRKVREADIADIGGMAEFETNAACCGATLAAGL